MVLAGPSLPDPCVHQAGDGWKWIALFHLSLFWSMRICQPGRLGSDEGRKVHLPSVPPFPLVDRRCPLGHHLLRKDCQVVAQPGAGRDHIVLSNSISGIRGLPVARVVGPEKCSLSIERGREDLARYSLAVRTSPASHLSDEEVVVLLSPHRL